MAWLSASSSANSLSKPREDEACDREDCFVVRETCFAVIGDSSPCFKLGGVAPDFTRAEEASDFSFALDRIVV